MHIPTCICREQRTSSGQVLKSRTQSNLLASWWEEKVHIPAKRNESPLREAIRIYEYPFRPIVNYSQLFIWYQTISRFTDRIPSLSIVVVIGPLVTAVPLVVAPSPLLLALLLQLVAAEHGAGLLDELAHLAVASVAAVAALLPAVVAAAARLEGVVAAVAARGGAEAAGGRVFVVVVAAA